MNRRAIVVTSTLLLWGLWPTATRAAPDDLSDLADTVITEAVAAANKKDWATCKIKAAGVWHSDKDFRAAGLLGFCEVERGEFREAAEHLTYFLEHDDKSRPARTKQIQEALDRAKREVGTLTLSCNVPGAELRLDGAPVDARTKFVDPGTYKLAATAEGFSPRSIEITLAKGDEKAVHLELVRSAAPLPTSSTSGPPIVPDDPPGKPALPAVVLFGLGAASVGVGIGLTVANANLVADVEERANAEPCRSAGKRCADGYRQDIDDADLLANVGIAMFAVGGAALIGGVIYVAIPNHEGAESTRLSVSPWGSGERGGASFSVSF